MTEGQGDKAWVDLPKPRIGVRKEDWTPKYSCLWTFVWVHVLQIPGCVLDLLCYEHSAMTYLSHRRLEGGAIEMRHQSTKDPNVVLLTTITPEPGAVELLARAEMDRDHAAEGELPDEMPRPNLCFRVKRADGCFSHFPDPFPDFISRCFV